MSGARRSKLIGRGLALLAGVAVGVLLIFGWTPRNTGPEIRGRALGEIREILLVEPNRGVEELVEPAEDGTFTVRAPSFAENPVLEIYAREGTALVQSPPVDLTKGKAWLELKPLAVWSAQLEVALRDERLRLRWSPIPFGQEGFPERAMYSVLLVYTKQSGERAESSLRSTSNTMELSLEELYAERTLPEIDRSKDEVELELRAFDPTHRVGPQWVGARMIWQLGSDQLRPVPPKQR